MTQEFIDALIEPDKKAIVDQWIQDKELTGAELKVKYEAEPSAFNDALKARYDLLTDPYEVLDRYGEPTTANLTDTGMYYITKDNAVDLPDGVGSGVITVTNHENGTEKRQVLQDNGSYREFERWDSGSGFGDSLSWRETPVSKAITDGYNEMLNKADASSLPQTFSGDSEPLDTLGKDYDRFHLYDIGSIQETEIYSGTATDEYSSWFFHLVDPLVGDPVQNDCRKIEVDAIDNQIYFGFVTGIDMPTDGLKLFVTNPAESEVEIDLTVISTTAHEIRTSYLSSGDDAMEKITDASTFRFVAMHGATADRDVDYEKRHGVWARQDFLSNESVHDLIRSYNTIVEQALADQKKPTRAEAITAFKTLPNHDWTKNDTFYIRDTVGANKMVFCTYIADGATDEATAGSLYFKDMNECV